MAEGNDSKLRNTKACVVIFAVLLVAIQAVMPFVQKDSDYITTAISMLYKDPNASASMIYDKASSVQLVMRLLHYSAVSNNASEYNFNAELNLKRPTTGPKFVEALQTLASVTQWTAKVDNSCLEMDRQGMDPIVKAAIEGVAVILFAILFACSSTAMVRCCGGCCACFLFFHAIGMGIIAFLAFKDSSGMDRLDCAKLVPWMANTIGTEAAEAAYSAYPSSFISASSLPTTVANMSAFSLVMPKIYSIYGNGTAQPLVDKCQNLYLITSAVSPSTSQAIVAAWASGVQGRGVNLGMKGTTTSFYDTVFRDTAHEANAFCAIMTDQLSTLFKSVAITMVVLIVVAVCLACFCARSFCIAREPSIKPSSSTVAPMEEKTGAKEAAPLIEKGEKTAPKKGFGLCSRTKCCNRQ